MGLLLLLILLVPVALVIIMLIGIVQWMSANESVRKKGKNIFVTSLIIFGSLILIGYAVCSGFM